MDVIALMEQRFLSAVQNDFIEKLEAGEIDSEARKQKLLDAYAEELLGKYPEWENLQASVVAGGSQPP